MTDLIMRVGGVWMLTGALTLAVVAAQARQTDMAQAPGVLPSGLGDAVDRDVASVRAATARFKSSEAAEAAGYKRVTDCVEHQPDGAMGYHFQNNALLDTTLDVEHPEVLVYERKPDGAFKLNGVEYLVPIARWTPPTRRKSWDSPSSAQTAWVSGTCTCGRGSQVRAGSSGTGMPA